jgi:hypothetical protein
MVKTFSGWLFNVMLWTAILGTLVLLYETFAAPGFLRSNEIASLAGLGVVAVLSLLWPKL